MSVACVRCDRPIPDDWLPYVDRAEPYCEPCVDAACERERQEQDEYERAERGRRCREACDVPPLFRNEWADVAPEIRRREVLEAAQVWPDGERRGLLLTGPIGAGKSTIAGALAWRRAGDGYPVRWVKTPSLLLDLDRDYKDPQRTRAIDAVRGRSALVLDDLGTEVAGERAASAIFDAIDGRMTAGAPLLVTTNLALSAIASRFPNEYGERIASRLAGYCDCLRVPGVDRRLRLAS